MTNPNFEKSNQLSGFTLIELLVVIFIIGILVSLLLANILGARQRAEDLERKNDLQQMKRALRLYYNDNQRYPPADEAPSIGEEFGDGDTIYIREVPFYERYSVDATRDRFVMMVYLDNASDQDIVKSQERCASSIGAVIFPLPDLSGAYVVCED